MTAAISCAAQAPSQPEALAGRTDLTATRLARVVGLVQTAAAVRAARCFHLTGDPGVFGIQLLQEVEIGDPVMGQAVVSFGLDQRDQPPRTK